jgi:hypothetical protein
MQEMMYVFAGESPFAFSWHGVIFPSAWAWRVLYCYDGDIIVAYLDNKSPICRFFVNWFLCH